MIPAVPPTGIFPAPTRSGIAAGAIFCLGLMMGLLPLPARAAEETAAPAPKPEQAPPAATTVPETVIPKSQEAPPAAVVVAEATPQPGSLAALNGRYQALLEQLKPYHIPQLDELTAAPAPTTLEDLTQRVDWLYAAAGFQSAHRYWVYENNLRRLADERLRLEEARVETGKLEQAMATVPERLRQAEAHVAELTGQAANEERIVGSLRDNATVLEEDFVAARGTTLGSVYYLLPTDQRVAFHEGTQKNANHSAYAQLPEVEPRQSPSVAPLVPKPRTPRQEMVDPTQPPPPVAGSLDEKFAAFEDKQRALRNLETVLPPQEKQLAELREQADAQIKQKQAAAVRLAEAERPLDQQTAATGEAENRIFTAQVNQRIFAGNLLRLGTSALLWNYLKESIVAPQMEHFLTDNGQTKIPKGTALLDAINRRPQNFVPKKGTYENSQPLSALRLRLLDVESELEMRGPAVAEAFQAGRITNGATLAERLFKNLDPQGIAVLRAATSTLAPGQDKIAAALLAGAPAK